MADTSKVIISTLDLAINWLSKNKVNEKKGIEIIFCLLILTLIVAGQFIYPEFLIIPPSYSFLSIGISSLTYFFVFIILYLSLRIFLKELLRHVSNKLEEYNSIQKFNTYPEKEKFHLAALIKVYENNNNHDFPFIFSNHSGVPDRTIQLLKRFNIVETKYRRINNGEWEYTINKKLWRKTVQPLLEKA